MHRIIILAIFVIFLLFLLNCFCGTRRVEYVTAYRPEKCCSSGNGSGSGSGNGNGSSIGVGSEGMTPLDKTNTTTDTQKCGNVWQIPIYGSGGAYVVGTTCLTVGKCITIEFPDTSACSTFGITFLAGTEFSSTSFRFDFNLANDSVDFNTGFSAFPNPPLKSQTPGLKALWQSGTNILKFCYISDTEMQLFVNGTQIGTTNFVHDAFPITTIALQSTCITTDVYAQVL